MTDPPSPHAAAFRPSPQRSTTLSTPGYYLGAKSRATSQPPGERMPDPSMASDVTASSQPASGRGSPGHANGAGHGNGHRSPSVGAIHGSGRSPNGGSDFGVIGGSRTPSRNGTSLAVGGGGTATRASSFSGMPDHGARTGFPPLARTLSAHVEEHPSRAASPFPTFSPSSSPSAESPSLPAPHSPPRADNVSRSRSQSLAAGARPDRSLLTPMSTLGYASPKDPFAPVGWRGGGGAKDGASNMSPFSGIRPIESRGRDRDRAGGAEDAYGSSPSQGRFGGGHDFGYTARPWASPAAGSALSSSIHRALGGTQAAAHLPPQQTALGGFERFDDGAGGGSKSGSSSRRHSVSGGIGGLGNRRFGFENGAGLTPFGAATGARAAPPFGGRGLGSLGFTDDELLPQRLDNALNLSIDHQRDARDARATAPRAPPSNGHAPGGGTRPSAMHAASMPVFNPLGQDAYAPSTAFGSSLTRTADIFGTPARGRTDMPPEALPRERGPSGESKASSGGRFSLDNAGAMASPPPPPPPIGRARPSSAYMPSSYNDVGPIGSPPVRAPPGYMGYRPDPMSMGRPMAFSPPLPGPASPGYRPSPMGYFGSAPARPPYAPSPYGYQPFSQGPPQASPPGMHADLFGYAPPSPGGGNMFPTSYSSISLADLGKGIPLSSLAPTAPLYIVAFKAGRRDVFYSVDPTLLISNGDWVIVEGDRGSDLGTVICDQLTPVDIREWQERQATATLLSGASQHQPPGMAVPGNAPTGGSRPGAAGGGAQLGGGGAGGIITTGEYAHADLAALLAGVGPTGPQMEMATGIGGRGPLAKEVMPKRIFAKSGQGPAEQARMQEKLRLENEALQLCREKAAARGLPMHIVDAEYQWDKRKLTFYFKADKRIDFRELTKENFRLFKSRIWMSMVPKDDPRQ